jgi:hypothetical protein
MWCIFSFGHEHVNKIPSMHSITVLCDSSLHENIMTLGSGYILIYVCLIYYCVMASHILYLKTIMTMFYECVYMYVPDIPKYIHQICLYVICDNYILARAVSSQDILSQINSLTADIIWTASFHHVHYVYYIDTMCELVVIAIWI